MLTNQPLNLLSSLAVQDSRMSLCLCRGGVHPSRSRWPPCFHLVQRHRLVVCPASLSCTRFCSSVAQVLGYCLRLPLALRPLLPPPSVFISRARLHFLVALWGRFRGSGPLVIIVRGQRVNSPYIYFNIILMIKRKKKVIRSCVLTAKFFFCH
jgi:hypothetical protein